MDGFRHGRGDGVGLVTSGSMAGAALDLDDDDRDGSNERGDDETLDPARPSSSG